MTRNLFEQSIDILLVISSVAALMAILSIYQRRYHPQPEALRKLMHVASGLLAATFPWLFDSTLPVIIVCTISLISMVALRRVELLKRSCGAVLGGVQRRSLGEMYFPVAIGFLYVLTDGQKAFYLIPILVMTLADTAAALIGIRFGRHSFRTLDGTKSVEGSVAFFVTALPCIVVPLSVWTSATPHQIVLTSVLVAGLLTVIEAGSWAGIDNFVVPSVGFLLLRASLNLSPETLALHTQTALLAAGATAIFCTLTAQGLRTVTVQSSRGYWLPVFLVTTFFCLELVQSGNAALQTDLNDAIAASGADSHPSAGSADLVASVTPIILNGTTSVSWR